MTKVVLTSRQEIPQVAAALCYFACNNAPHDGAEAHTRTAACCCLGDLHLAGKLKWRTLAPVPSCVLPLLFIS